MTSIPRQECEDNQRNIHGRVSFWRNIAGALFAFIFVNGTILFFFVYTYMNSISSDADKKSTDNRMEIRLISKDVGYIKEKVDKQEQVQQQILDEVRKK